MPVKLHKVKWFADQTFIARHGAQKGELPNPEPISKVAQRKRTKKAPSSMPGTAANGTPKATDQAAVPAALQPPSTRAPLTISDHVASIIKEIRVDHLQTDEHARVTGATDSMQRVADKIQAFSKYVGRSSIGDAKLDNVLNNVQGV